jgi:hypothetical protein
VSTKILTGSYPAGYYLEPTHQTLDIAASAFVGGNGVTTNASAPSTVNNLGTVYTTGLQTGVDLSDGGRVTNGGTANGVALIQGYRGIVITGAAGTVINHATIWPTIYRYQGAGFYGSIIKPSVNMSAGGAVLNDAGADIGAGVSIGGGAGTVINNGLIGSSYSSVYTYFDDGYSEPVLSVVTYDAIQLTAGGEVVNGAPGHASARVEGGVSISGGAGTVINGGTIFGAGTLTVGGVPSGLSVELDGGGTVINGADNGIVALLTNGVSIGGGTGRVTNFGTIGVAGTAGVNPAAGIILSAGGRIANGVVGDSAALISGATGVILDGAGKVTNYATIASNLGSGGVAVMLGGPNDTLVEEGSGVMIGQVQGGGGHLVLGAAAGTGAIAGIGGSITGFKNISVQAGAGWHFIGAETIVSGVTLRNAAAIVDDGSLVNDGVIQASALIELTTGAVLDNAAAGKIFLIGDVAIAPATGATGTSFVNAGLLEKLNGAGVSRIRQSVTETGHIAVLSGVLDFAGVANTIAGLISGAGEMEFHLGATTLETGTTITVAELEITGTGASVTVATNLTYAHAFLAAGGTSLTVGDGEALKLNGEVSGGGMLNIGAGATLEFGATVALGGKVGFTGADGLLLLADAADFRASVSGFGAGQTIDLRSIAFGSGETVTYSGGAGSGTLVVTSGAERARIALIGQYMAANFHTASDGHGGTDITFAATPAPALATPG